jgi:hypothetical protein
MCMTSGERCYVRWLFKDHASRRKPVAHNRSRRFCRQHRTTVYTKLGGKIAAELAMAYRIRGGVHQMLPENDHFELESLFTGLMCAAVLTFVEVRGKAAPSLPLAGSTTAPVP